VTPYTFLIPGQIVFGRGTAAQAAGLVLSRGGRIVLVHGANAARADWLHADLQAQGGQVVMLPCPGEPDVPGLESAVALLRPMRPDVIVALGGGSAIDMGKALAALLPGTGVPLDHLEVVGQGLPLLVDPLPFIALPTTAGTGAEATRNAVLTVPDHARKVSLRDPRMIPDVAIVDSILMEGAPKAVVLAAGLDAVTQVIEPYLCNRANSLTDAICRDAIPRGLRALKAVIEGPGPQDWDDMAHVSLCGGIALSNAGLGAVHGLAGVIGGVTGAAHGAICGVLLPHVLAANAAAAAPDSDLAARCHWVLDQVAQVYGGLSAFDAWARGHGLPRLVVAAGDRAAIAAAARVSSSMRANPVDLSVDDLEQIMSAAA
jgi:alcohol dehydrogenase class IV